MAINIPLSCTSFKENLYHMILHENSLILNISVNIIKSAHKTASNLCYPEYGKPSNYWKSWTMTHLYNTRVNIQAIQ